MLIHLKDWHARESKSTKIPPYADTKTHLHAQRFTLNTKWLLCLWREKPRSAAQNKKVNNTVAWQKPHRCQREFLVPEGGLPNSRLSVWACAPNWPSPKPISTGMKSPALICCWDKGQTADCLEWALSHYASTWKPLAGTETGPHQSGRSTQTRCMCKQTYESERTTCKQGGKCTWKSRKR